VASTKEGNAESLGVSITTTTLALLEQVMLLDHHIFGSHGVMASLSRADLLIPGTV
jgi:hypothetical protein